MKHRDKNYPGTQTAVTAPFFVFECKNGHRYFSVLPHSNNCPECGSETKLLIRKKAEHET